MCFLHFRYYCMSYFIIKSPPSALSISCDKEWVTCWDYIVPVQCLLLLSLLKLELLHHDYLGGGTVVSLPPIGVNLNVYVVHGGDKHQVEDSANVGEVGKMKTDYRDQITGPSISNYLTDFRYIYYSNWKSCLIKHKIFINASKVSCTILFIQSLPIINI